MTYPVIKNTIITINGKDYELTVQVNMEEVVAIVKSVQVVKIRPLEEKKSE